MIVKAKKDKKRKPKKVQNSALTVNGTESRFVDATLLETSYSGSKSIPVRKALRKIVQDYDTD